MRSRAEPRNEDSEEGSGMTRTRYRFCESSHPHFITCTAVAWLPVFSQPPFAQIIIDSLKFLTTHRDIDIIAYVLLENHLHAIALGPDLGKRIGEFKSFTARQIIDGMKKRGFTTMLDELKFYKNRHKIDQQFQLWQEGCHPKVIEHEDVMEQKIEYIHINPVKRGFIDDPVHWRYSSARDYAGHTGPIPICTNWR